MTYTGFFNDIDGLFVFGVCYMPCIVGRRADFASMSILIVY